ncbi:cyclic nucleotide-binding/CBS domain-containing protein [Haloarchaeobius sp. HME9146]|uniref:CBS domain-containing protein n=1 Tax=Haloarchaeobius sp. HME9146 TaxID=2978732 RepID=UPI0021BF764E|nr:CBS domain-containing protein [Haloarchaeobius sp. HME9146]MCT9096628.1 CBS domain-containing protein [Haloarchaeobius sp. HME9146]
MERDVSIRDVTTREYVGVSESDTVLSTVRLMRDEGVGSVLVMRGSDPVGIMTERDVLWMVAENLDPETTTVDHLMSEPVVSIGADESLAAAADRMSREEIRNLLVTDSDDILGVLSERDVIDATGPLRETRSLDDVTGTTATEATVAANGGDTDEYGSQGVCELCGSLADSLHDANGQLVCQNCRQV